jgi:hypothetical protein
MATIYTNILPPFPSSFTNINKFRVFVKYYLLNDDHEEHKICVYRIFNKYNFIPYDLIKIILKYMFCSKRQKDRYMNYCTQMYKNDVNELCYLLNSLNSRRFTKSLHQLEYLRQTHWRLFKERCIPEFMNELSLNNNSGLYMLFNSNSNYLEILNTYIHILKIDSIDLSYSIPRLNLAGTNDNINFDLLFLIDWKNGLTYKKLFTELYEKVDHNCEKLDLDFKINLSDPNTRISWNFNVYAKLLTFDFNYTRRDGLVACHAGALFGFFLLKLIDRIESEMLHRINYCAIDLALPQL